MEKGYIRLSRKFFDNAYWKQQRTFSLSEAWLDLIQSARFEAEPAIITLPNGREITIKRGEVFAGLRFLSDRWGWSVEKTKRFIDKHIEKHEIERRSEHSQSVLKLCNYDFYNPTANTDQYTDQYTDPHTDQYTARTLTSTLTSTKNNKENKENKDNTPPTPSTGAEGECVLSAEEKFPFEKAWELYGRKGNKKTCIRKWANLKNHCREAAMKHIPLYVEATPDRQYRKNFETYINQEAWNDEVIFRKDAGTSGDDDELKKMIDNSLNKTDINE